MSKPTSADPSPIPLEVGRRTTESEIGPPPIMGTWRRFYGLVLAVLAADVLIFWLVTRIFS